MASSLINRNIEGTQGRSSMRLEQAFWDSLEEICHREQITLADLIKLIQKNGDWNQGKSLTSMVRVFTITYFKQADDAAGNADAGRGELGEVGPTES